MQITARDNFIRFSRPWLYSLRISPLLKIFFYTIKRVGLALYAIFFEFIQSLFGLFFPLGITSEKNQVTLYKKL